MEVSHMNEVFGLNLEAWERWIRYRKDIRKSYKSQDSIDLAKRKLASFGDMQMQAVENSIGNGWTGLFAPPKERKAFKVQQQEQRDEIELERLKARALRVNFREPFKGEDVLGYRTLVERAEARPVSRGTSLVSQLLTSKVVQ